jgi:DNA modification methylase
MGCERVNLGNGITAIVCTRGQRRAKCSNCGRMRADLLCDWKLKGKKAGKTCDRKLCHGCATEVGPEKHHGHATPKPVAVASRVISSSAKPGGLVLEPFLGSGTTLIAAHATERRCFGMEITPAYCDVVVERWQNFTGGKATR